MPDCVDLTLDSDDENAAGLRGRKRSGPPTPDSDCIIVDGDPEPDQQHKRQRLDAAADEEDADVVVESATGTVRDWSQHHLPKQHQQLPMTCMLCFSNRWHCAIWPTRGLSAETMPSGQATVKTTASAAAR
jgi:hypothetical protein